MEQLQIAHTLESQEHAEVGRAGQSTWVSSAYSCLPTYPSSAFWAAARAGEISLEVLARYTRIAVKDGDILGRNRLLALILERVQASNLCWARRVLRSVQPCSGEEKAMVDDLCADLAECLMRALVDPSRPFWEENFQHCLYFERKHVYRSFMMREGRWHDPLVQKSERIPRTLLARLDQPAHHDVEGDAPLELEDERCQELFQAIERYDILEAVLRLPSHLKAVVLLRFWEARTEKETARVLGVTDRTVRNRVREALSQLKKMLHHEKGLLYE